VPKLEIMSVSDIEINGFYFLASTFYWYHVKLCFLWAVITLNLLEYNIFLTDHYDFSEHNCIFNNNVKANSQYWLTRKVTKTSEFHKFRCYRKPSLMQTLAIIFLPSNQKTRNQLVRLCLESSYTVE